MEVTGKDGIPLIAVSINEREELGKRMAFILDADAHRMQADDHEP